MPKVQTSVNVKLKLYQAAKSNKIKFSDAIDAGLRLLIANSKYKRGESMANINEELPDKRILYDKNEKIRKLVKKCEELSQKANNELQKGQKERVQNS